MEAMGSIVMDLPYKAANAVAINASVYLMCNLRLEPGPFFLFPLISFIITIIMFSNLSFPWLGDQDCLDGFGFFGDHTVHAHNL